MGSNPQTALRNALLLISQGPCLRSEVTNAMKNFTPEVRRMVWSFLVGFQLIRIYPSIPTKGQGKGGGGAVIVLKSFGADILSGIERSHAGA